MITRVKERLRYIPGLVPLWRRCKPFIFRVRIALGIGHRFQIQYVNLPGGFSLVRNVNSGATFFLPYPSVMEFNAIQLRILSLGFDKHLGKKYSHDNIFFARGDTVIDCGGFVGGFSVAAIKNGARQVIYVEPTPLSRQCAEANFVLHGVADKVSVVVGGLGETDTVGTLQISNSGADNSFLEPDEGATGVEIEVPIHSVDTLSIRFGLDPAQTFFKVEAEGFEPEIIRGMNVFLPRCVAVDVTPERDGVSPREEIQAMLRDKGYTRFAHSDRCLFAARDGSNDPAFPK